MARAKTANGLTIKQEAFAQAFIETGNASEAYRRAYDCGKMKEATINREAKRLIDNPHIATRIAEGQGQAAEKHGITVDWLVSQFKGIAEADVSEMLEWNADGEITLKPSKSLPKRMTAAISEVSRGRNGFKFKLHDRQAALVSLGRHLGMFKDVQEIMGKGGGPIETKDVSDTERARRIAYILGRAVGRGEAAAKAPAEVDEATNPQ